jgi:type IV secretory pathway VirB9-like protein
MKVYLFLILLSSFLLTAESDIFMSDDSVDSKSKSSSLIKTDKLDHIIDLNLTQNVLRNSTNPNMILKIFHKVNKTYKIVTRKNMNSIIVFHDDKISYFTVGNNKSFKVKNLGLGKYDLSNILLIKPNFVGVDTQLTVIGESGRIYTFYIYSINHLSKETPKSLIYVSFKSKDIKPLKITNIEKINFENRKSKNDKNNKKKKNIGSEYFFIGKGIKKIKINSNEVVRDLTQKGAKELEALDIFRDKKWTYFKFSNNTALNKLPVIYEVIDGYDNPVNSRVIGNYLIAETISTKFTLKRGDSYSCVRLKEIDDE